MCHSKPIFPFLLLLLPAQLFFPNHSALRPDWSDDMVLIPGGTFKMGDKAGESDEQPVHAVTVSSFYLSKYEVTVADFKAFVDATGFKTEAEKQGWSNVWGQGNWVETKGINWRHNAHGERLPAGKYKHPVLHVNWADAMAYCKWLSLKTGQTYRLPTEAEWEYAAGNGSRHTKYSWGNKMPKGKKGGNVADKSLSEAYNDLDIFKGYADGYLLTAPVGSFAPNKLGLYDMTGNAWEWCSDWYAADYYADSPKSNPTGPDSGTERVWRGGCWLNNPWSSRTSFRSYGEPDGVNFGFVGFRVAR